MRKTRKAKKYPIKPRRSIRIELLGPNEREEKVKEWYRKKEKETKKIFVEEELLDQMKLLEREIKRKTIQNAREKSRKLRELEFEKLLKKSRRKKQKLTL